MPKSLIRLVALLLVPCLLADPVAAATASPDVWRAATASVPHSPVFDQQALSILPTWWRNARQPSAFRERREVGHTPAASNPTARFSIRELDLHQPLPPDIRKQLKRLFEAKMEELSGDKGDAETFLDGLVEEAGRARYWVAVDETGVIRGELLVEILLDESQANLASLFVDPEARRNRIGVQLIENAMDAMVRMPNVYTVYALDQSGFMDEVDPSQGTIIGRTLTRSVRPEFRFQEIPADSGEYYWERPVAPAGMVWSRNGRLTPAAQQISMQMFYLATKAEIEQMMSDDGWLLTRDGGRRRSSMRLAMARNNLKNAPEDPNAIIDQALGTQAVEDDQLHIDSLRDVFLDAIVRGIFPARECVKTFGPLIDLEVKWVQDHKTGRKVFDLRLRDLVDWVDELHEAPLIRLNDLFVQAIWPLMDRLNVRVQGKSQFNREVYVDASFNRVTQEATSLTQPIHRDWNLNREVDDTNFVAGMRFKPDSPGDLTDRLFRLLAHYPEPMSARIALELLGLDDEQWATVSGILKDLADTHEIHRLFKGTAGSETLYSLDPITVPPWGTSPKPHFSQEDVENVMKAYGLPMTVGLIRWFLKDYRANASDIQKILVRLVKRNMIEEIRHAEGARLRNRYLWKTQVPGAVETPRKGSPFPSGEISGVVFGVNITWAKLAYLVATVSTLVVSAIAVCAALLAWGIRRLLSEPSNRSSRTFLSPSPRNFVASGVLGGLLYYVSYGLMGLLALSQFHSRILLVPVLIVGMSGLAAGGLLTAWAVYAAGRWAFAVSYQNRSRIWRGLNVLDQKLPQVSDHGVWRWMRTILAAASLVFYAVHTYLEPLMLGTHGPAFGIFYELFWLTFDQHMPAAIVAGIISAILFVLFRDSRPFRFGGRMLSVVGDALRSISYRVPRTAGLLQRVWERIKTPAPAPARWRAVRQAAILSVFVILISGNALTHGLRFQLQHQARAIKMLIDPPVVSPHIFKPENAPSVSQLVTLLAELQSWKARRGEPSPKELRAWIEAHFFDNESVVFYQNRETFPNAWQKELLTLPAAARRRVFEAVESFILNEQTIGLHSWPLRTQMVELKEFLCHFLDRTLENKDFLIEERKAIIPFFAALQTYQDRFQGDALFQAKYTDALPGLITANLRFEGATALRNLRDEELKPYAPVITEEAYQPIFEASFAAITPTGEGAWRYTAPDDFQAELARLRGFRLSGESQRGASDAAAVEAARHILQPYQSDIEASARAYNVPPDHLALILLVNSAWKTHETLYTLRSGIGVMESWFPEMKKFHFYDLMGVFPKPVQEIGLPDYWDNFAAGVIAGVSPTQGLMMLRTYRVRELQPWKRFGITVTPDWSDRKINLYLLNPQLNIEAMAALLRYQVNYMMTQQNAGHFMNWPLLKAYSYQSSLLDHYDPIWGPDWAAQMLGTAEFGQANPDFTNGGSRGNGIFEVDYLNDFAGTMHDAYELVLKTGLFAPHPVSSSVQTEPVLIFHSKLQSRHGLNSAA